MEIRKSIYAKIDYYKYVSRSNIHYTTIYKASKSRSPRVFTELRVKVLIESVREKVLVFRTRVYKGGNNGMSCKKNNLQRL